VKIEIKDFAFSPSEVEVKPGTRVTFINRDKVKHTATADGGEFDTGLLEQDKSKTVTFDKEGTFTFYCSPHPNMTGKIVVKAK
jgi:plastocyanin